jgi:hypothetical protein
MMNRFTLAVLTAFALGATGALAQAPADSHDQHHPAAAGTPEPGPAQAAPLAGQAATGGQQGMMGNMPRMMDMMDMMRMMGGGPAGMPMIDHVEGRIAFLRTELKITDAQANAWNAFADALRTNAKRLGEVRASMMSRMGAGQQQAPTLADQLNLQEQWLVARLEGTRAIKSAFTNLYAVLSDEQKKTASELFGPHMGLETMGMMAGQMGPGQMQRGQMQMQRPPAGR